MIGRTLTHYKIETKLSFGGMGEVYAAEDLKLNRKVALKLLPDSATADATTLERFQQEGRAVAALDHPNIVTIYSVEESEGIHFLVMELVEGETLAELIAGSGLSLDRFFEFAVSIATALGAAHERGIVHGDLKPANIMVTEDGRVKVLDFGLAKLQDVEIAFDADGTSVPTITEEKTISGTVPYMAPEQLKGKVIDQRSDLFSFGVVLFEMCTGQRPFQGDSSAELVSSILRDTPVSVTDLNNKCPVRLARLIGRCLEKDPQDRYQTAVELRSELEELEREVRAGAVALEKPSIAVLAFADMSAEQDQQYFCYGMAEELINALIQIEGLRVAARTSAFSFTGRDLDVREIGKKLNVNTVLEGSVRKSGNRLRITTQLINVVDGYHLWSEQYDREMKDIFEIQDEIAQNVVHSLELALSPDEQRVLSGPGTSDVQAYDYYLRGRKFLYQHRQKGIELALQMFSQAIEQDVEFALAYSGIAECCYFLYSYYDGGDACLQQADEASRKAIELGPELAETHTSCGGILSLHGRHAEAEVEFETAIRLGPQLFDAYYLYARDSFAQGNLEKADSLYSRATEVDPDDYQTRLLLAQVCDDLGHTARAESARRRGVEIIRKRIVAYPDDVRALYLGANGLAVLGEMEMALEWAALALSIEPEDSFVLYNVACIYSVAGKFDEAMDYLEQTVVCGLTKRRWLDRDSDLDPIRCLPRFQALLENLE